MTLAPFLALALFGAAPAHALDAAADAAARKANLEKMGMTCGSASLTDPRITGGELVAVECAIGQQLHVLLGVTGTGLSVSAVASPVAAGKALVLGFKEQHFPAGSVVTDPAQKKAIDALVGSVDGATHYRAPGWLGRMGAFGEGSSLIVVSDDADGRAAVDVMKLNRKEP